MITIKEKEKIWKKVSEEFPSDLMMRDLHFIRELIFVLKKKGEGKTFTELSEIARNEFIEFIEWLKIYPEFKDGYGKNK